jgi:hypothetical protein
MKSNNKIALVLITGLLAVSFIATAPMNSRAVSSEIFKSHTGHDLSESHWSIIYDTIGSKLEEDHNPGPYQADLKKGKTDNHTNIDSKYYFAWNNLQNVHSAYLAMQNFTWNVGAYNNSLYGCAPYQMFLQHFRLPNNPDHHVFVMNKFLGLMAYQDGTNGIKNLPDENDSLYLGWARFSEWHKFLVNSIFNGSNVAEYHLVDRSEKGTATPIEMEYNSETGTYKFGMCYEDIFVLWQKISVKEGLDQNVKDTELLSNCSAFGMFSSINFTFKIHSEESNTNPGYNEITTTTEYDIGELDDLWVIGDDDNRASDFNGESFQVLGDVDIGHYNSTGDGITKRLNGSSTVPGFGLSVINTAKTVVLDVPNWYTQPEKIDNITFTDPDNNQLGDSFMNISQSQLSYNDTLAYSINFASKPNYTWNDEESHRAPTRVLKNSMMQTNTSNFVNLQTRIALGTLIGSLTGNIWAGFSNEIFKDQYFSMTCFPKWQGKSIHQDPTFTVLVASEDQKGIPGFELTVVGLVGLCSISLITYKVWKKKKLE